ncbi:l-lactate permease [Lasius niger]|uniref:L-lactate permease n=1 Tax=Lasius niger TaxID=67767 RepID=A0A0J7NGH1_LASNI|nr:l-lactate permease [Lasius niger]
METPETVGDSDSRGSKEHDRLVTLQTVRHERHLRGLTVHRRFPKGVVKRAVCAEIIVVNTLPPLLGRFLPVVVAHHERMVPFAEDVSRGSGITLLDVVVQLFYLTETAVLANDGLKQVSESWPILVFSGESSAAWFERKIEKIKSDKQ